MKKLFTLLLLATMLISCSSDDDNDQDYTSYAIVNNTSIDLPNVVIAYKDRNEYKKLNVINTLPKGTTSDEFTLNNSSISELYIFTDYNSVIRFDAIYSISKNKRNNVHIASGTKGIMVNDKTDPTQYPQ